MTDETREIRARRLRLERHLLFLKATRLTLLNEAGESMCSATGFIRKTCDGLFLYSCWHVVSGIPIDEIGAPNNFPERKQIQIEFQEANLVTESIERVGGRTSLTLPLYSASGMPLWEQDRQHIRDPALNDFGVYRPFWHDAVRLRIPDDTHISSTQIVSEGTEIDLLTLGDKVYVVGYPYSYSVGSDQITPVVLTRFIAAGSIPSERQRFLLDSAGIEAMSGSPVFVDLDGEVSLVGIYIGTRNPDAIRSGKPDPFAALGHCSDLKLHLAGALEMTDTPIKEPTGKIEFEFTLGPS